MTIVSRLQNIEQWLTAALTHFVCPHCSVLSREMFPKIIKSGNDKFKCILRQAYNYFNLCRFPYFDIYEQFIWDEKKPENMFETLNVIAIPEPTKSKNPIDSGMSNIRNCLTIR